MTHVPDFFMRRNQFLYCIENAKIATRVCKQDFFADTILYYFLFMILFKANIQRD